MFVLFNLLKTLFCKFFQSTQKTDKKVQCYEKTKTLSLNNLAPIAQEKFKLYYNDK